MNSIKPLIEYVKKAGDKAAEEQTRVMRDFKNDGSIITHIDRELNSYLSDAVRKLYPEANLITEETVDEFDETKKYSFAIDPVDGTDAYSQLIPGWCVSVGLLKDNQPAAGIVYAPLWGPKGGIMIYCDIESPVFINGVEMPGLLQMNADDDLQIMTSSKMHRHFNLSDFKGKIRTAGAAVINILSPLLHRAVGAALITPCSIWDIAAAHAIVKRAGLDFSYYSGRDVDYTELYERSLCSDFILTGRKDACTLVRKTLHLKS